MRTKRRRRSLRRVPLRSECRKVRDICCIRQTQQLNAERTNPSDLTELDLPPTMKTNFPDPADLLNFTLTITPDEGMHSIFEAYSQSCSYTLQACTRVALLFSSSTSTQTTLTSHRRSSAHRLYVTSESTSRAIYAYDRHRRYTTRTSTSRAMCA